MKRVQGCFSAYAGGEPKWSRRTEAKTVEKNGKNAYPDLENSKKTK